MDANKPILKSGSEKKKRTVYPTSIKLYEKIQNIGKGAFGDVRD